MLTRLNSGRGVEKKKPRELQCGGNYCIPDSGVIGVLNLMNVIFTGAIARQREFASMRSIGMTKGQLRKLFIYEGIMYAILAGTAGIAISAWFLTLVKGLTAGWWFARYRFAILPAVVTALILSSSQPLFLPLWTDFGTKAVVEQLREVIE